MRTNLFRNSLIKLLIPAKYLSLIIVALFISAIAIAQPGGGDGDPDETVIPFDGGLSVLVAAGVAYGAKKAYDKKKEK